MNERQSQFRVTQGTTSGRPSPSVYVFATVEMRQAFGYGSQVAYRSGGKTEVSCMLDWDGDKDGGWETRGKSGYDPGFVVQYRHRNFTL